MLCHTSLDVCVQRHFRHLGSMTPAGQVTEDRCHESMHERRTARNDGEKPADVRRRMKRQYGAHVFRLCRCLNGTESLKVGYHTWMMQLALADLTLRIGLTLMLKWNE